MSTTPENDVQAYFQPATDPNDPAVKERRVLESIARKQADAQQRLGKPTANGYYTPKPGAEPSRIYGYQPPRSDRPAL